MASLDGGERDDCDADGDEDRDYADDDDEGGAAGRRECPYCLDASLSTRRMRRRRQRESLKDSKW